MVPYVFVSSTIEDLHHLRDAIRDVVTELAFHPMMSEYGDIGYLPSKSAVESCYATMKECQLAVLIVGKRYGNVGEDGRSVTHNEFQAARDVRVPVICLVDREMISYKKMFDANRGSPIVVPGMDAADKTFALIDEITRATANNAVLAFATVSEARTLIKGQLAHLVGDLLRRAQDPVKADIREVLAEIKTLRHELTKGTDRQAPEFMRAARYLLDEDNNEYREIVEVLFESVEAGIPTLLECESFPEIVIRATASAPHHIALKTWADAEEFVAANESTFAKWYFTGSEEVEQGPVAFIATTIGREQALVNDRMLNDGQEWQTEFRRSVYAA
jgi:hypothetical protein